MFTATVVKSTIACLLIGATAVTLPVKALEPITVGAVVAAAQQIQPVWEKLNSDRSVILEVDNNTNLTLKRARYHHSHGGFAVPPTSQIAPKTPSVFGSQKLGGAVLTGTEGTVTYAGNGFQLTVYWDNPYVGKAKCSYRLSGPNAKQYRAVATCGSGNEKAQMRYELFAR